MTLSLLLLAIWTGVAKGAGRAIVFPYTWGGGRADKPVAVEDFFAILRGGTDCSGAFGLIVWVLTGTWAPNTVKGFQKSLSPLASYQGEKHAAGVCAGSDGAGYHIEYIIMSCGTDVVLTLASAGGGEGDVGVIDHNTGFGLRVRPLSFFQQFYVMPNAVLSPLSALQYDSSQAAAGSGAGSGAGAGVGGALKDGASLKEGSDLRGTYGG